MRNATRIGVLVGLLASSVLVRPANAHCQVPCGIYSDQLRFEQMLEDHKTIAKAITSIAELSDKADPQSVNQAVRWVMTKEDHASKAQGVIAEYFMTQRIKADDPEYARKLAAAHKVMTTAMACKQSTDPAAADAFREAILDFYRAYEGKEPVLEEG